MASLGRRKFALGTRRASFRLASFRSPLTAFIVALALIVQLIAMPYQQALAGPALAGSDAATIAADLKAIFGDAAGFCAHIDDKGAPSPHGPCNHCDDQCPLCRFVAQAAAFVPPDAPALPGQLDAGRYTIGAAPDFGAFSACPAQTQPRPRPAPRRLTIVRRAAPRSARPHSFNSGAPFHVAYPNPFGRGCALGRGRGPVAHARLPSRCLRRPHLPGHDRHRRSRRSGRAHAADRQLGSLQFRWRPRVGRELQLDQDDHPGPQRCDRLRTDMGAPGRLRLEPARHRAAVAGAVHPRRRVHDEGRLRRHLGRNRHRNPGGLRAGKHLLSAGGLWSRLRNAAAHPQIFAPVRHHGRIQHNRAGLRLGERHTLRHYLQLGVHPAVQPAVLQLARR